MKNLIFALAFLVCWKTGAQSLEAVRLNKEGAALLQQQNFLLAEEKFLKALSRDPLMSALHVNLGLAFELAGQTEKAQASYLTAAKLALSERTDQIRFVAFFNLGQMMGKLKNVTAALEYYQQALELKPDSQETKVNIELLIQQNAGGGQGQKDKDDKNKDKDKKDKDDQDQNDKKDDEKDGKDKDKPKEYQKNKPQPKKFKSEELTQGDVNKILGEIKQQEQKIRQDYNRKDVKEKPRGKDW
jgi:tetratricopeptide (TPR) repeat protein